MKTVTGAIFAAAVPKMNEFVMGGMRANFYSFLICFRAVVYLGAKMPAESRAFGRCEQLKRTDIINSKLRAWRFAIFLKESP